MRPVVTDKSCAVVGAQVKFDPMVIQAAIRSAIDQATDATPDMRYIAFESNHLVSCNSCSGYKVLTPNDPREEIAASRRGILVSPIVQPTSGRSGRCEFRDCDANEGHKKPSSQPLMIRIN
jgi:hypothetical protein